MLIWRTILAVLACLPLVTLTDIALQSDARAQFCPEDIHIYVLRDGRRVSIRYCLQRWTGIDADTVGAGGDDQTVDGVKQPPTIKSFPRASVRFICWLKCPDNLPTAEAEEDAVVWTDKIRTTGRIMVDGKCTQRPCGVRQDGTVVRIDSRWQDIQPKWSLIELSRGAAP